MAFMKNTMRSRGGSIIVSVLLGIGLATIFQRVCKDNCVVFHAPAADRIAEKVWVNEETCYKYTPEPVSCDASKGVTPVAAMRHVPLQ